MTINADMMYYTLKRTDINTKCTISHDKKKYWEKKY